MDYRARRAELLARGEIFLDANFKPNNNSIYLDGLPRHRTYGKGPITWKRPSEIFENAAPYFLVGGSARFDLNQGAIGNCWFVAAAATLVTVSPKKFSRVVPTDQSFTSDYAGIFRFNFWWYGDWVEVCVDDYLPCDQEGILFCQNRNQPNEFWPCLLEKAYAKLHGSYEALEGGKLHHALIDFTGGMTEVFVLENPSQVPRDLINIIVNTYSMDTLMGASIYRPAGATAREVRKSNGLYMGHAYSITGVMSTGLNTQLQNGHSIVRLIRLRNPWGLGEWNGAWSDRSPEVANLSAADRQRLQLVTRHDGEFWISYEDFVREFDELQMCHMVPDAFSGEIREDTVKQEWHVAPFQGSWQHKETGCCPWLCGSVVHFDNEQYYVQLREVDETGKCTLIVSLMEKEVRTSSIDLPEILIGFSVFRLRDNNLQPLDRKYKNRADLVATAGEYEVYREMCKRFVVAPGTYVIIAQTHRPGDQADYILRLYTKKPAAVGLFKLRGSLSKVSDRAGVDDMLTWYCGDRYR